MESKAFQGEAEEEKKKKKKKDPLTRVFLET
jgi:hypothetical protein